MIEILLEDYFATFRQQVIGQDLVFATPDGQQRLLYADWTASGRLYQPIEKQLQETFGPLVGNTHTETSLVGTSMTEAYRVAREIIKDHVGATADDVLILTGSGMTSAVNKLQRLLGLRAPSALVPYLQFPDHHRPLVFVSHMEHHSNHTSWLETIAEVRVIPRTADGLIDLLKLERWLTAALADRLKIVAVTAASNVTGIEPPVHDIARLIHAVGGLCFVDYACAAPYVAITMHPPDPAAVLDAIYFSPHKFLGGPGTPGVLIVARRLIEQPVPDQPGGGTVLWTNPWGNHRYLADIEAREDGGTPPFLQTIKAALVIKLKERMGVENIRRREKEILDRLFPQLETIKGLRILAGQHKDRLGVISLTIDGLHYNLVTKLFNDRFGIQVRGGCACAGTYGHYLLGIDQSASKLITDRLDRGDASLRPGFVRLSIHPIMTDAEIDRLSDAVGQIAEHGQVWARDYRYQPATNEFVHRTFKDPTLKMIRKAFDQPFE